MLAATLCSDAKGTRCQAQLVERASEYGTTRSRLEHVLAETRNLSSGKILLRLQTKSFKLNGHLR
jgi:hypothetical protein